jgi:hypothetical protein
MEDNKNVSEPLLQQAISQSVTIIGPLPSLRLCAAASSRVELRTKF